MKSDSNKVVPMRPRSSPKNCLVTGCGKPHYGGGFCRLHWRRSRPRSDGRVPTLLEVAGIEKRVAPERFAIAGRVTKDALARMNKGVQMGLATSLYELVSRWGEAFDPEAEAVRRKGAHRKAG